MRRAVGGGAGAGNPARSGRGPAARTPGAAALTGPIRADRRFSGRSQARLACCVWAH
ncbi:hypothetical protein [Lysobacter gummosus]|uniref:hypothetical protein n=1 Tax=Lysobacter gummosus TaxID=262324 RepID=UPI0036284C88